MSLAPKSKEQCWSDYMRYKNTCVGTSTDKCDADFKEASEGYPYYSHYKTKFDDCIGQRTKYAQECTLGIDAGHQAWIDRLKRYQTKCANKKNTARELLWREKGHEHRENGQHHTQKHIEQYILSLTKDYTNHDPAETYKEICQEYYNQFTTSPYKELIDKKRKTGKSKMFLSEVDKLIRSKNTGFQIEDNVMFNVLEEGEKDLFNQLKDQQNHDKKKRQTKENEKALNSAINNVKMHKTMYKTMVDIETKFRKDVEETGKLYMVMRDTPDILIPLHRDMKHYQEAFEYAEHSYKDCVARLKYLYSKDFIVEEFYKKLETRLALNKTTPYMDIVDSVFEEYINSLLDKTSNHSSQSNHSNHSSHSNHSNHSSKTKNKSQTRKKKKGKKGKTQKKK